MSDISMLDMDDENFDAELQFALSTTGSSSDYRNDRDRPYNGQPQTSEGIRGSAPVIGLTFRDVQDCYVKGLLLCCGVDQPELYERVLNGTWRTMDIFKVNFEHIDPLAVMQSMICEMEKMMCIFPNCPSFDVKAFLEMDRE